MISKKANARFRMGRRPVRLRGILSCLISLSIVAEKRRIVKTENAARRFLDGSRSPVVWYICWIICDSTDYEVVVWTFLT
jgi:hypothetical protein